jgi:hypothetical protein
MLENTQSPLTFVHIVNGRFAIVVEAGTKYAVERTKKNGFKVHEQYFDTITGTIEKITDETTENEHGSWRNLVLTMTAKNETCRLNLQYSSRETKGILMRLPNADIKKPLSLKIGRKDRAFTWVTQKGETVPLKWTKDNPGELPRMEKIMMGGKETWDDTDQMDYLIKYINDNVLPITDPNHVPTKPDQAFNSPQLPPPDLMYNADRDDLPF